VWFGEGGGGPKVGLQKGGGRGSEPTIQVGRGHSICNLPSESATISLCKAAGGALTKEGGAGGGLCAGGYVPCLVRRERPGDFSIEVGRGKWG